MNSLYDKIRESLRDYVKPEDLDDVTGWMYYEMATHVMKHRIKRGGFWILIGFVLGMLTIGWIR